MLNTISQPAASIHPQSGGIAASRAVILNTTNNHFNLLVCLRLELARALVGALGEEAAKFSTSSTRTAVTFLDTRERETRVELSRRRQPRFELCKHIVIESRESPTLISEVGEIGSHLGQMSPPSFVCLCLARCVWAQGGNVRPCSGRSSRRDCPRWKHTALRRSRHKVTSPSIALPLLDLTK